MSKAIIDAFCTLIPRMDGAITADCWRSSAEILCRYLQILDCANRASTALLALVEHRPTDLDKNEVTESLIEAMSFTPTIHAKATLCSACVLVSDAANVEILLRNIIPDMSDNLTASLAMLYNVLLKAKMSECVEQIRNYLVNATTCWERLIQLMVTIEKNDDGQTRSCLRSKTPSMTIDADEPENLGTLIVNTTKMAGIMLFESESSNPTMIAVFGATINTLMRLGLVDITGEIKI